MVRRHAGCTAPPRHLPCDDRNLMRRDPLEQAHLAKIVESSDDAIVSKDLDGTIRSWNRAAERMFGYSAQEAVGRSIRMIIPSDLQSEEDSVLQRIRAGQVVDHFETRRQRQDGSEVLVSLTVSPLLDDHGRVIGASKIARDVTEASRLRTLVREQGAVAQTLSEIGAAIAASLDQHTIIQRVTDAAAALSNADVGVFVSSLVEPATASAFRAVLENTRSRRRFHDGPCREGRGNARSGAERERPPAGTGRHGRSAFRPRAARGRPPRRRADPQRSPRADQERFRRATRGAVARPPAACLVHAPTRDDGNRARVVGVAGARELAPVSRRP